MNSVGLGRLGHRAHVRLQAEPSEVRVDDRRPQLHASGARSALRGERLGEVEYRASAIRPAHTSVWKLDEMKGP
eukprot:CAMPEP_0119478180 /NCGR_PEP_ID=MMETSP1344-20130328/8037_1 /TAXON_ID=236787 /ORGANISM="Florenciella parvula, Strain CCMP2471" /LENGTH=73 /DNA_ID=CAMNT_0007512331 /DNA_START=707 /DNA_END=928 /DNA_ORIENTATION=+